MPTKDMPSPYSRDAPKFHHEKPEELNRYICRLEELFLKYSIDADDKGCTGSHLNLHNLRLLSMILQLE
jgi:hypothetical protein